MRAAVHDPLRDQAAHSPRAGKAVGAESRRHPESAHLGWTEDELAVRRERLRPVHEANDARVLQCGGANDGVRHQRLEALPVRLEQLPVEVRRDAAETPRLRVALVPAHDQPAGFGSVVDEQRRVAHRRHVAWEVRGSRDEVLVRHRDERHRDADEAADL